MDIYPAIDIRDGQVVRLLKGDYDNETVYSADPAAQARAYEAAGAAWIHVVDLDAARSGQSANRELIAAICAAVDLPVQCGGGVRDMASAMALADAGVERVVVGTAAVENPDFVAELVQEMPVAVGLDARAGNLATDGWETASGADLLTVASHFSSGGVAAFVVTEIERDGTLEGPDLAGLASVLEAVPTPVIASGGVGTVDHVATLAALTGGGRQLAGAIIGRALYEGTVDLDAAVAAGAGSGSHQ